MAIFLKHGDIRGAATKSNRREWLEVESFSFSMEGPAASAAAGGGAARNAHRSVYSGYDLVRLADCATPVMLEVALKECHLGVFWNVVQ